MVCACVSPCYHLSSLLLLVGNEGDSNRNDKMYENSHLPCYLEAKMCSCLYHNIDANNTFSVLGLILIAAFQFFFLKRLVTGMT